MKNIKNNPMMQLIMLFVVIFMVNTFAMRMSEAGKKSLQSYIQKQKKQQSQKPMSKEQQEKMEQERKQELEEAFESDEQHIQRQLQRERERQYQPNKYFIYEQDTANGILVDFKMAKLNSTTIKDTVENFGEEPKEIPLPCSFDIIQLGFGLLENTVDIHALSLAQLVDVANLFNFLAVPADKMNVVVTEIKEKIIDKNNGTIVANEIKQLHPDLQKILLINPVIDHLKTFIIKKYAQDRKKVLINSPGSINAVAFTPDGTQLFSSEEYYGAVKFLLWNISDPNPHKRELFGHQGEVTCLSCSPDGRYMVSGSEGNQNNLLLWDMNDLDHPKPLVGHPQNVNVVAFSFDSKYIISGSGGNQDNLIVWDITNPQGVIHQVLVGHPTGDHTGVRTVAFSPDNTQIISGSKGNRDNLILWSMNNWGINHSDIIITSQKLEGHPEEVSKALFSPDGKKVVSACYASVWSMAPDFINNILLWDISDPNDIQKKWLGEASCCYHSVDFSPDSKSIVSSFTHSKDIRLWDVSDFNNITKQILKGHSNYVLSVKFSPDGQRIVSAGECGQYLTGNNLILWDVNDKNSIIHQSLKGHSYVVYKAAFSADGKKMISGGRGFSSILILWTLLTDQEEALLNRLKNYEADQIRLIYQLCSQFLKDQKITLKKGSEEDAIFKTLPQDMQNLLNDLFSLKSWFSGWW